jgi:hypothetical protein
MPSLTPTSPLPMRNARTPAERMRLFRRRRKFRRQVVKVEVDPGEVDALIDRGYLGAKDRDDRKLLVVVTASHSCGGRSIFAWEERTLKRPAPFRRAIRCDDVTAYAWRCHLS